LPAVSLSPVRGQGGEAFRVSRWSGVTEATATSIGRYSRPHRHREGGSLMLPPDLQAFVETYQGTLNDVVRGDADAAEALWSRRDDVTLANPVGPPVRGWAAVEQA